MPKITVLPHPQLCPKGASFDVESGVSVCDALLGQHIDIEHACEKSCACTTCHVIVKQGFNSLAPSEEEEDDLLDKAWGLTSLSRLSCQALVAQTDLTVEIPKYTINHAREHYDKDWDV
ncbi:2Fe-2S iron-sulfur cluster-binding family protein [Chitinimonas naiadis]